MKWTALVFGGCLVGCGAGLAEQAPVEPAVMTRRDVEPRGPHCANGGTAIRSGADRNGNKVLDNAEVQHTDYVCDPATAVLIRRDPLGPDAMCPTGGTAVRTGIDGNGDGVLDDSEVKSTTEVCSPAETWEGDVTAADWAEPNKVTALQSVRVVTGRLTIDTADPVTLPALELVIGGLDIRAGATPIELPGLRAVDGGASVELVGDVAPAMAKLARIGGDLLLDGPGGVGGLSGAMIDAPALREVGGSLRIGATVQIDVSLPGVQTLGGDLVAELGGHVTRIALPDLETITGSVRISWQPALIDVSLPASQTIGGKAEIWACPALARIELGTIEVGSTLLVANTPVLATLSLPRLKIAPGSAGFFGGVEIGLTGLSTLELPALRQTNRLFLHDNAALTAVQLPALTDIARLVFMENGNLASVSAPQVTTLENLEIEVFGFDVRFATPPLHALDFGKLTTVDDRILITGAALPDLSAFRNVRHVHRLWLDQIVQLPDLRGLASLAEVDSLTLTSLTSLTSLDGLEWLTELAEGLALQWNPALMSINALRGLTRVGDWFQIASNHALADIALPALTEIGGEMQFEDMPAVTDLSGLSAVRSVSGDVTFRDNALSDDQVAAFLRQIGR